MKRANRSTDKGYGEYNTQSEGAVIEEEEEAKPEVASRSDGDVAASVQAVVETHDEEPQVTALPVLHGNGAVDHNAAVQSAPGEEAMLVNARPTDTTSHSQYCAVRKVVDRLRLWEVDEYTEENNKQQIRLAREMTKQGNPVAMYQLYLFLKKNSNMPSAQQECRALLFEAGERGWVPALDSLALEFSSTGDEDASRTYFRKAESHWPAFKAHVEQMGLPLRVSQIKMVPDLYLHGLLWTGHLAMAGWPGAHRAVANLLLQRARSEIEEKAAYRWLELGAATGDAKAMLALGMLCEHGIGTAQNSARALALYEQAGDKGLAEAQVKLASVYAQHSMSPKWRDAGVQTEGKTTIAYEWCLRAMKQGPGNAKLQMAQLLATGDGVAKDVKAAFALCKEAADSGLYQAHLPLALMYVTGTGTEPDDDEAAYHALDEVDGCEDGAYLLAKIHEGEDQKILDTAQRFGMQLTVNKIRAFTWYREAGWEMIDGDPDKKVRELVEEGHRVFIDKDEAREWTQYEKWKDEWSDISHPIDVGDPENVRELVEESIRKGAWKLSLGKCINLISGLRGVSNWTTYLPHALNKAPRLTHLYLSENGLEDRSAGDIAQIIRETSTLEVLDLRKSQFTEAGYRTIAATMRGNFTLRRVLIDATRYNSEESRLIRGLCARNRKLQKLWAEFKLPSPLTFMEVPMEISELLESALIHQDQKDGMQSASATRQRVLEMLMCLQPMVLQARPGAKTT